MGVVCSSESGSQPQTVEKEERKENMELYFSPVSPPSRAVLLTLRALNLTPEYKELDLFQKGEHKQAWYLKINPTHTVPTLVDNDFNLWESRAIMTYLVNKYGNDDSLYPKDPQQRAKVDKMLYFDVGTLYKSIIDYWAPQIFGDQPPDSQKANVLKQSLEYLDTFLDETGYAATKNLTIADLSLVASVTSLEPYNYDYSSYENVTNWVGRLKDELPYYEDCLQKGLNQTKALVDTMLKR